MEQTVETNKNIRILYAASVELTIVEALTEIEGQPDISNYYGILKFVGVLSQLVAYLPHK